PGRGTSSWPLLRADFLFPQQVFDLFQLVPHEEHVGHVELVGVSPGRPHDQVARPQAQDPVAEAVIPPRLCRHPAPPPRTSGTTLPAFTQDAPPPPRACRTRSAPGVKIMYS